MKVIAFTGQISSGKTTKLVAYKEVLLKENKSVRIFFADEVAKEAYEDDDLGFKLDQIFGERETEEIFEADDLRKQVEDVIHPYVFERMKQAIENGTKAGIDYLLVEVPILKEERIQFFDQIFYLTDDKEKRLNAAISRGMSKEQFELRDAILQKMPVPISNKIVMVENSLQSE